MTWVITPLNEINELNFSLNLLQTRQIVTSRQRLTVLNVRLLNHLLIIDIFRESPQNVDYFVSISPGFLRIQ